MISTRIYGGTVRLLGGPGPRRSGEPGHSTRAGASAVPTPSRFLEYHRKRLAHYAALMSRTQPGR
jgi:hypothetical protein